MIHNNSTTTDTPRARPHTPLTTPTATTRATRTPIARVCSRTSTWITSTTPATIPAITPVLRNTGVIAGIVAGVVEVIHVEVLEQTRAIGVRVARVVAVGVVSGVCGLARGVSVVVELLCINGGSCLR